MCIRDRRDVALALEVLVIVEERGVNEGVLCELNQTGADGILRAHAEGWTCSSGADLGT